MKRLSGLVMGLVIGAVAMFTSMKYHIVRAEDGFHLIHKAESSLQAIYTDIRTFTLQDWNNHRVLAEAIARSDNRELVNQAAASSVQQTVNGAMEQFSSGN